MNINALSSLARRGLTSCGLVATGVFVSVAFAAGEAHAQANPCAIYGAGFVSVTGTDTCVRIGGRVRVEGAVVPPQNFFGSGGNLDFAPGGASPLDGPDRAHLRLQGGPDAGMPRTR